MNGQPHSHEVEIREGTYNWVLEYGDQQKKQWKHGFCGIYHWHWFFQRRMDRKIKRMIKKHDKASVFVGNRHDRARVLRDHYNAQLVEKSEGSYYAQGKKAWATELMKQKNDA